MINFNCDGELTDHSGEEFEVTIVKTNTSDSEYTIFLPNDVQFDGILEYNTLLIPAQIFNAEEAFDRVSLTGTFKARENDNLLFDFTTSTDDDEHICKTLLIKINFNDIPINVNILRVISDSTTQQLSAFGTS